MSWSLSARGFVQHGLSLGKAMTGSMLRYEFANRIGSCTKLDYAHWLGAEAWSQRQLMACRTAVPVVQQLVALVHQVQVRQVLYVVQVGGDGRRSCIRVAPGAQLVPLELHGQAVLGRH